MEWDILEPKHYEKFMQEKNVHSLLAKVLCLADEDLEKQVPLRDFRLFSEADKALTRIRQAIARKEKVVIYGDYDCDGIMATSILVRAFELCGLSVGYHIPNRFTDGYGLNASRVKEMAHKGYSLIITVDNGISAKEAVKQARELGIDVIITDHHDLPNQLPEAYAIIHTGISPDYPFKGLSGGFVAAKLAEAMLQVRDPYIECLAALSTVSDMMPMIDENRTLVRQALEEMKQRRYLSFELLLGEKKTYDTTTLGFIFAPKINSIGRLDEGMNPNKCVTYFRHAKAHSPAEHHFKLQFAQAALELNQSRQRLTTSQYEMALTNMQEIGGGLVAAGTFFHEGLVGLVAGKLMSQFYRPSFVVRYDETKGIYKGSARSIDGIDMHDCLCQLADYLLVFGGHEKAGGFSLKAAQWPMFLSALRTYFLQYLTADLLIQKKHAIRLEKSDLTLASLKELACLEPFGQANEEPIFYLSLNQPDRIDLLSDGKHLKLVFSLPTGSLTALWFSHGEAYTALKEKKQLELFGKLSVNKYRNFENMQMIISEIR